MADGLDSQLTTAAPSAHPPMLYTIGHSTLPWATCLARLRRLGTHTLIDVRSAPFSRIAPQYDRPVLAAACAVAGIAYRWEGAYLGARPQDETCWGDDDRLDLRRWISSPGFQAALDRVVGDALAHPTVLLCAEQDAVRCHRALVLGPQLEARGLRMGHLTDMGDVQDPWTFEVDLMTVAGVGGFDLLQSHQEAVASAYHALSARLAARCRRSVSGLESFPR